MNYDVVKCDLNETDATTAATTARYRAAAAKYELIDDGINVKAVWSRANIQRVSVGTRGSPPPPSYIRERSRSPVRLRAWPAVGGFEVVELPPIYAPPQLADGCSHVDAVNTPPPSPADAPHHPFWSMNFAERAQSMYRAWDTQGKRKHPILYLTVT